MINFDWTVSIPVLISLATIVYAHLRTRRTDVDDRFKLGSDRMDRHERRIQSIEQQIAAMPGKDDIHVLHLDIAKISGSLGRMEAVMEGNAKIMQRLETIVSRHEDHLLSGSRS